MPIFTYRCRQCGMPVEMIVLYAERDAQHYQHDGPDYDGKERCGGKLERNLGLEKPTIGKPAFQMKALLGSGAKVKGHFNKEAKRKRKS